MRHDYYSLLQHLRELPDRHPLCAPWGIAIAMNADAGASAAPPPTPAWRGANVLPTRSAAARWMPCLLDPPPGAVIPPTAGNDNALQSRCLLKRRNNHLDGCEVVTKQARVVVG